MTDRDGVPSPSRKNTANIVLFAQIAPFQWTAITAPGNIDENRSLPYKPRQLSAMIRFDRGGSIWAGNGLLWACQHRRTYLNIRQVVSLTGNRLSAENDP
jgi:hypothetical protein